MGLREAAKKASSGAREEHLRAMQERLAYRLRVTLGEFEEEVEYYYAQRPEAVVASVDGLWFSEERDQLMVLVLVSSWPDWVSVNNLVELGNTLERAEALTLDERKKMLGPLIHLAPLPESKAIPPQPEDE